MRAVSSITDFAPALADVFFDVASSRHGGKLYATCSGCSVAAEGAFAAAMRKWEWFVKELIIDLMSGAQTAQRNGPYCRCNYTHASRPDARNSLLRSRYSASTGAVTVKSQPANYILLHNPAMVAAVASHWLTDSSVEAVFNGYAQDIERIVHLRHGIAHGTPHAQAQGTAAMLSLDPLNAYGSTGEFLASSNPNSSDSWLEVILGFLVQWSMELSP